MSNFDYDKVCGGYSIWCNWIDELAFNTISDGVSLGLVEGGLLLCGY